MRYRSSMLARRGKMGGADDGVGVWMRSGDMALVGGGGGIIDRVHDGAYIWWWHLFGLWFLY